jgi:hypothetical protein
LNHQWKIASGGAGMLNHNHSCYLSLCLAALLLIGCATTNAPTNWLDDVEHAAAGSYGGWIDVRTATSRISGELIAINGDTVFVVRDSLMQIMSADVIRVRLVYYDASTLAGQVILGTLSTVSNGLFLIFTAPMWLIGGPLAAGARTYEPVLDYPEHSLPDFRPYARYPVSIPPGMDRSRIKLKIRHH